MHQTGLIENAHSDLVTDASYDFYGLRLATCSLDQRIKVWQLDEANGTWSVEDDWKAHDAAVSKVTWAHPEFGPVIASASFDRTVKVWEQASLTALLESQRTNINGSAQSSSKWLERAVLTEARGTVRAVEFAPHQFGLKLATIATDNHLRVYECLEQPSLGSWTLSEEVDIETLPLAVSPNTLSHAHTVALATPTQTNATLEGASASLVAQALQQGLGNQQQPQRPGIGNREADGGWSLSWCKDRYWGELIAVSAGTNGVVKIIQLSPSRRPITILTLDPSPAPSAATSSSAPAAVPSTSAQPAGSGTTVDSSDPAHVPETFAINTVSWAPSCGRSYHLIATGGRDGRVRIWKVKPGEESYVTLNEDHDGRDTTGSEEGRWTASVVADFDSHKSSVGRVEWNITGTVLSSAGNDGRIRLWKATSGNVWRPAGSIGVEQTEKQDQEMEKETKDVEMES